MMRRHLDSSVSELIATATHLKTHEESQTKAFAEVRRSANPSKLCGFCQELVNIDWVSASEESEERVETVHYSHHPTDEDLKMASINGCAFCTQVLQNPLWPYLCRERKLAREQAGRIEPFPTSSFVKLVYFPSISIGRFQIYFFIGSGDCWSVYWVDTFEVSSSNASDKSAPFSNSSITLEHVQRYAPDSITGRKMKSNTTDGLSFARQWYRTCCNSHGNQCHPRQSLGIRPTRLLDLVDSPPRLCLGQDLDRNSKYAALSHCWGSLQFVTLKMENCQQFLERIPDEALPKTFREACCVTKALGLRYLWIDSLCIIQDDEIDWLAESARMIDVYGSAEVTIAASGASDGSEGCFLDREDTWKCEVAVSIKGQKHDVTIVPPSYVFQERQEKMPLESRGWALQERVMSHRVLSFTKTEIFWQCSTMNNCETFPYSTSFMDSMALHYFRNMFSSSFEAAWIAIVYRYTKRNLSNPRDKLIALAGLAQMIQRGHQQEDNSYIIGLWREDLEVQLSWHLEEQEGQLPRSASRPSLYRAPTWSWASIEGGGSIDMCLWSIDLSLLPAKPAGKRQVFIKIVDLISIPLVPGNPFGEIRYAELRITCTPLFVATVEQTPSLARGNIGPHFLDIPGEGIQQKGWLVWIDVEKETFPTNTETVSVYGLHVAGGGALLLQPTGNKQGEYKRIGMMSTNGDSPSWGFVAPEAYTRNPSEYTEIIIGENGEHTRSPTSSSSQARVTTPALNHLSEMNYEIVLI